MANAHDFDEDREPGFFKPGDLVHLHPATDLWMRGATAGVVTKVGRKYVQVKLDNHPRLKPISIHPGLLSPSV